MPEIWCQQEDCKNLHCDRCTAKMIEIDDDGTCSTFEDYRETPEYQEEFFKAVRTHDGEPGRVKCKGKRITVNGVDFYTQSSPNCSLEHITVTHAFSGFFCGNLKELQEQWSEFMKTNAPTTDVHSFPIAEFDEESREYFIKKESGGEKNG